MQKRGALLYPLENVRLLWDRADSRRGPHAPAPAGSICRNTPKHKTAGGAALQRLQLHDQGYFCSALLNGASCCLLRHHASSRSEGSVDHKTDGMYFFRTPVCRTGFHRSEDTPDRHACQQQESGEQHQPDGRRRYPDVIVQLFRGRYPVNAFLTKMCLPSSFSDSFYTVRAGCRAGRIEHHGSKDKRSYVASSMIINIRPS